MTIGMTQYHRLGRSLAMLVAFGASTAAAAEPATPWSGFEEAEVRLISGQTAAGQEQTLQFGLQFRVNDGWKTYWRYPGEAGAAPRMDWSASQNVAGIQVDWPAPHRFSAFGFDNFGYDKDFVLPIAVTPQSAGRPVDLALKLDYLVCSDICVPGEAELRLTLADGAAASSAFAPVIADFRRKVPPRGESSPFSLGDPSLEGEPGQEVLRLKLAAKSALTAPDLLVEVAQPLSLGRPEVSLSDDGLAAEVRFKVFDGGSKQSLAGQAMRLTVIDGTQSGEHILRLQPRAE